MIEQSVEVKTFLVTAICGVDNCDGELKPTGEAYMTNPPKYIHVCNKCRNYESFRDKYPVTRFMPVE